MKVFGHKLVDFALGEIKCSDFATHGIQRVSIWIAQGAEIGGIHLGMPTEAAEILIDDGGV
jgi:hypothetical protein